MSGCSSKTGVETEGYKLTVALALGAIIATEHCASLRCRGRTPRGIVREVWCA